MAERTLQNAEDDLIRSAMEHIQGETQELRLWLERPQGSAVNAAAVSLGRLAQAMLCSSLTLDYSDPPTVVAALNAALATAKLPWRLTPWTN